MQWFEAVMTDVGVYMIVHRVSGYAYVGQSNNIPNRWMEHTKQLHDGSHHNRNLLNLWQREGGAAFEFRIICHAPVGLTPLETQRWLAKKELEVYRELKQKNRALNIVAPEIVETAAAYDEFKRREPEILKEERRVLRNINQSITADIRDIKEQLSQVRARMFQSKRMIDAANIEAKEARRLLHRNTGWKRFLIGSTDLRSKEALETAAQEAEAKLLALQSAQTELEKLELNLRDRNRRAYISYPKNSDRYARRTALFAGLTPKKKPRIR
jgi:hypothetical protein